MKFTSIPCHESLRPFIRNYWLLELRSNGGGWLKVFPNGASSLHFYLSQEIFIDSESRGYRTSLNRQDLGVMQLFTHDGPFVVLGVEFLPFCSRLFFSEPADLPHITPQDIQDPDYALLEESVFAAGDIAEQTRLLDDFFCKRISEIPVDEYNIERLSDVFVGIVPMEGEPSAVKDFQMPSPNDLAQSANLSQKQFTRIFADNVGLNPKSYLRLIRFNKALRQLHNNDSDSTFTEIAWRCGYCDLAHMTKDFRQLCGYTPSDIVAMGVDLSETLNSKFSAQMKKKLLLERLE